MNAALQDATARVFAPAGVLEANVPGYETREGQRRMADAIAQAIARRSILLAEAGTGTGKTFAYLVPAFLSGKKVVVSTATKNLQDQIVQRDVPKLLQALGSAGLARQVSVAVLKGRQNYLCLLRLENVSRQPSLRFRGERDAFEEIREWAGKTDSGERSELRALPDDYAPWRELDARGDACIGHKCKFYERCFVTRARQRAAAASVVVVNHHLFFADLALRQQPHVDSPVLPSYEAVIFDEAHALEDAVTEHFGVSFSEARVNELNKDITQLLQDETADDAPRVRTLLGDVPLHMARLFALTGDAQQPRPLPMAGASIEVLQAAQQVSVSFERLADALEDAGEEPAWQAIAERARRMAYEVAFVCAPEPDGAPPRYARMIEQRVRTRTLKALPLSVDSVLAKTIFNDGAATIMTSATLSLAGDFRVVRERLGVQTAEEIVVQSPFDFGRQALLYVPQDFPEPNQQGYDAGVSEQLLQLVEAARGGAFLLFTSHAALDRQAAALTPLLHERGFLVLRQGEAPKATLVERFAADGSAVLFASASFWEGVDVPGQALRLVCIDKLPFASPTDPLLAARIADCERRGERAFDVHQLAPAVFALRQGFGRLIRTTRDGGVVAVLDVRLRTRGYGRKFLRALPNAPLTGRLDRVAALYTAGATAEPSVR